MCKPHQKKSIKYREQSEMLTAYADLLLWKLYKPLLLELHEHEQIIFHKKISQIMKILVLHLIAGKDWTDAWDEIRELLSTVVTRDKKVHTQQENLLKKHIWY